MESDTITISQLPKAAPFALNSSAIIMTIDRDRVRYWVAPEAVLSTRSGNLARGTVQDDGKLYVTSFDNPSEQICVLIDHEDAEFWDVRMIEVVFADFLPEASCDINTMTEKTEDEMAKISLLLSKVGVMHNSLSDLEIWWGKELPVEHMKLNPETYMRTKFEIGVRIAQNGSPIPFDFETPPSDLEKVIISAHVKSLLDGVLHITKTRNPDDFSRIFHNCVAMYSVMVRANLIAPRQYNPDVFDASYMVNRRMGASWQVNLGIFYKVLEFDIEAGKKQKELWHDDDVIIVLGEEDTEKIRELSNVKKGPDTKHKAFIIEFTDPDIEVMPNEDLIDFLEANDIFIDTTLLDENKRYTYAIAEEWTNKAFRDFFKEKGEADRFSEIDDDDWLPADYA